MIVYFIVKKKKKIRILYCIYVFDIEICLNKDK
jgi:hypothetical protein